MQFDNYRIRKYDDLNIVVEEFIEGGEKLTGALAGKESKDHWAIKSYHSDLNHAFKAFSKRVVGDNLNTVESVMTAIKYAQDWIEANYKGVKLDG